MNQGEGKEGGGLRSVIRQEVSFGDHNEGCKGRRGVGERRKTMYDGRNEGSEGCGVE